MSKVSAGLSLTLLEERVAALEAIEARRSGERERKRRQRKRMEAGDTLLADLIVPDCFKAVLIAMNFLDRNVDDQPDRIREAAERYMATVDVMDISLRMSRVTPRSAR